MATTQRSKLAKSRAKNGKSGTKKPISVAFSEQTLEAMKPIKAKQGEAIAQGLITDNPTLAERFLKLANFADRGQFLTADLLGAASKAELSAWASECGIEVGASWPKDRIIRTMLESDKLALPRELAQLRPRI